MISNKEEISTGSILKFNVGYKTTQGVNQCCGINL